MGGQEQYKVELCSSNNLNFAELFCKYGGFRNDDEYIYINAYENPAFEITLNWDIKTAITFHIGGEIIKATNNYEFGEFRFIYEDDDYTSFYPSLTNNHVNDFKKKKLVKFRWRNPFGSIAKIKKSDFWICQGDVDNLDPKSHKQSILLPCQLMKVGNVKDRLYWDIDEGRYMIEKNIKTTNLPTLGNINSRLTDKGCEYERSNLPLSSWNKTFKGIDTGGQSYWESHHHVLNKPLMLIPGTNVVSYYSNSHLLGNMSGKLVSITNQGNNVRALFRDTECLDVEEMNKWIKTFEGKVVYYIVSEPELIETDITERIDLPCYNPTTHIIVNSGDIEPSNVKALFPMKGIEWEYDKKSGTPVSIRTLCSEYCIGDDINLNIFSDNQMLEMDLYEVKCVNNDPQIMLLCGENTGGKVYWDHGVLKVANDKNFILNLKTPCRLTVILKKDNFSLYIDGALKASGSVYTSIWFKYTGIQCMYNNRDLIVTGFRYKNFNRGE